MAAVTESHRPYDEALAWLALALIQELPPRRAFALVLRFGSALGLLGAPAGELAAAGLSPETVRAAPVRARHEAVALARARASLVAWSDPSYPPRLREIADPPLALAVCGTLPAPDDVSVAVVGMRRASEYGRRVAEELARELAEAGVTVVSGLAAGIDAAAHRGALAAGGRTLAVLGTGIDRVYPAWHAKLARAIAAQGALVSEFPCGTPPFHFNFPRRNRIISGLTVGTVVVEAAEQSGSLITARFALEQNRQIYAIPGTLGPAGHRGPHRLIQQGAKLVTCARDVLDDVAPQLTPRLRARRSAAAEATLTASERRILEALGAEGRHVDEVIRQAGLSAGPALEVLLALELRGLVDQLPGKRFRRLAA